MCARARVLMCIRDVCAHVLIVTLYHCVFIGVCDVENVNFSQQADEAAIRNLYMHVYTLCVRMCAFVCVVHHPFTRLFTIFSSYLYDLQLLSTPV